MLIDAHVHMFSEKIAQKALTNLANICKSPYFTNGTLSDTKEKLKSWGVDAAMAMNIATKPTQQTVVNNWAASIDDPTIYGFGSVHPDAPDALDELQRIKDLDLYGVKLHPDYQGFLIDDPKMFPIYDAISSLGLPVTFHTGWDPLSPDLIHATPQAVDKVVKLFPHMTVIAAHMGGMARYQEAEEYVAGLPLYIDTAMSARLCSPEQFERLVSKHGSERVLFASDCPWSRSCDEFAFIERTHLTDREKENIYYKNAQRVLGLSH